MWVGQSVPSRELEPLLRGAGQYVADVRLPATLTLAVKRSPHAHARLRSVALQRGPGLPRCHDFLDGAAVAGVTEPFAFAHRGHEARPLRFHALAVDRVLHAGHAVAAVVADDRYAAEDLLEAVAVEYEPLPVVADPAAALAGATRLYPEWPDNVLLRHGTSAGDPDAALARADLVISDRFATQRHTGHPMETRGCLAHWAAGRLTLWTNNQWPHSLRIMLAEYLRLPLEQVRVISAQVGGSSITSTPKRCSAPWPACGWAGPCAGSRTGRSILSPRSTPVSRPTS